MHYYFLNIFFKIIVFNVFPLHLGYKRLHFHHFISCLLQLRHSMVGIYQ